MTEQHAVPVSRATRRAAAVLLAASTLTIMAAAVISPALPAMQIEYDQVPDVDLLVRLVITITSAAIALSAPIAGMLSARAGTRPVLVIGLILYGVAGTSGLIIDDLTLLLCSRAILGFGVGAIMTAVSTTIAALWRDDRRTQLLAGQQLFASLGGVVFLSLAGWLSTFQWRMPFWIYGISLLLLPLLAVTPLAPPAASGVRPRGTGIGSTTMWLIAGVYVLALVTTAVFFLVPTQLPFALDRLGLSASITGLIVAASTATGVVGSLIFPRLRKRLTAPSVAALSLAMLAVGSLIIGWSAASSWAGILAGTLIGGVGVGLIVPDLSLWLSDLSDRPRRGLILGGLVSAIFAGQFLSPILAQPLIDHAGIAGTFAAGGAGLVAIAAFITVPLAIQTRRSTPDLSVPLPMPEPQERRETA